MIDACVKYNEINKALELFEEISKVKIYFKFKISKIFYFMIKHNIEPSEITYGILIKAFGKNKDLLSAFRIFE